MTTVSSTLKIFDAMTKPLQQITTSMNIVIGTMQAMQSTTGNSVDISGLKKAKELLVIAEADMKASIEETIASQERLNNSIRKQPVPQWETLDSMKIFQTSGAERFKEELTSVNHMIQQMSHNRIQFDNVKFLPPNAVQNLEQVNERVERLQQLLIKAEQNKRKLLEQKNFNGFDEANKDIENIRNTLHQTVSTQKDLNRAMQQGDLSTTNQAYKRLIQNIDSAERNIRESNQAQKRFNQSVQQGVSQSNRLAHAVGGIASAYMAFRGIQQAIGLSDEYVSTAARLNLINDNLQTTEELQDKIMASANRTGALYKTTADAVARLGMQASQAFSSNDELIAFTEQLNKTFAIAGTRGAGLESVMLQLTQAMAAGRLQGEELNAILDNAQPIVQNIADYMKVPVGSIKELASEGAITANIIKNAMFAAAEETNRKFEEMPRTFGQSMNLMRNEATKAFEDVLKKINQWLNSDQGAFAMQSLIGAIQVASQVAGVLLDAFQKITSFVQDNWLPITIGGIALVIGLLWAMVAPIVAQTVAWLAANWPILLITAAVILLTYTLQELGYTTEEIIGGMIATFSGLGTMIYNFIANLYNRFAMIAEFVNNVFEDPVYAVKKLFYDMIMSVVGNLESLTGSFDKVATFIGNVFVDAANRAIKGVNWIIKGLKAIGMNVNEIKPLEATGTAVFSTGLTTLIDNLKPPTTDNEDILTLPRMELMNVADAVEKGYNAGKNLVSNVDEKMKKLNDIMNGQDEASKDQAYDFTSTNNINLDGLDEIGKVKEVGKIKDSVDISNEDLKLLREFAEMKNIQNFVTLTPQVSVTTGDIRETADADSIIDRITKRLEEELVATADGVYN